MTYDELLIEINRRLDVAYYNGDPQSMRALRAVVELCNFLDKKGHCCVPVKEVIQAIEKELG